MRACKPIPEADGVLMLDEWAHGLIKQYNMTKKQYYNVTVIIRQTLEYAVDLGIIESSPMADVRINGKRMFRIEETGVRTESWTV